MTTVLPRITPALIAKRCVRREVLERGSEEEIANEVLNVTRIRLDREQLTEIDGLDCLNDATHLYLQFVWRYNNHDTC
eukprot:EC722872.1.p1 GENE.EC722872.1~~EC722872.1.p1  ORF type:complete len:78 (+),score=1.15 EC722872.1:128-361(+)